MLLPHPCWLALFLTHQEVSYLRRLAGPASLEDWRCSCLCPELIPLVTKRSALFVKELSFPHTTPTDDVFFSTETGLERIGGVRPELGLLLSRSAGFECETPLQKQEKKRVGEGSARGRSNA